jgi:uncharacterized damage-inducible protein DinB
VTTPTPDTAVVLTPEDLLKHWQGHRGLTRRVIDAFPEDALFNYSIGGMRTMAELVNEFFRLGVPTLRGVVTGDWTAPPRANPSTKADILARWDEDTREIERLWPGLTLERFHEVDTAFGRFTGPVHWLISYVIDNEIHHRGQGYVYLRSLGIEPPAFYER